MATFVSGPVPQIRVGLIREDTSLPCCDPHTRARKHETNDLRGPISPPMTTYASALTGTPADTSAAHDRQLITSMASIEKIIVNQLTSTRGRHKGVTFDASSYGPSDKRGRSASRDQGRPRKVTPVSKPCNYLARRYRDSHSRAECWLAKTHESQG